MSSKTTRSPLAAFLIGLALIPSLVAAQAVGYGQSGFPINTDLQTLGLLTSNDELYSRPLFDAGITGIEALALRPDGTLYAAVHDDDGPETLWTLNPAKGTAAPIGDLGVPFVEFADLALDSEGGLWLAAGGILYSVDTETGLATPVTGDVTQLSTIAFLDDSLFGTVGNPIDGWTLVEVDPTTAIFTPVTPIPAIQGNIIFSVVLVGLSGMDFDDDGGLWISAVYFGGIALSVYQTEIYYLNDPFSGEVTSHAPIVADDIRWSALAVAGSPKVPVEVPALSTVGLAVLAMALFVVALALIRGSARDRARWGR